MFTSIGKKVITTTTAAFDCQSKPNHITMIGATPTIGSAETRLPIGKRPRCRNCERSIRIATMKPAQRADDVAREHALDRLPEIGGERGYGGDEARRDRRGRRQDDRRHVEEPDPRLPEREHGEAEGERRQELAEAPQVSWTNAMRRCAMRPATPIAPTSVADSAAAANKAAQICTVCP